MKVNWIPALAGLVAVYALVSLWPEIEKYRRLRAM